MKLLGALLKLLVYLVTILLLSSGIILGAAYVADYVYVEQNASKIPAFDGFQFETYKASTDIELQNALLKLHPIGSETEALRSRFKGLTPFDWVTENGKAGISISYTDYPIHFIDFIRKTWNISVVDDHGKIESITVTSYLTGP